MGAYILAIIVIDGFEEKIDDRASIFDEMAGFQLIDKA